MSNYKEKFEAVKSFVTNLMKEPEVLAEVSPTAESTQPAPQENPQEAYVTLSQFNELKENTVEFMNTVTEMLSSAMEMWNQTEKNAVPQELAKENVEGNVQEVQEEVQEAVELAAEPFVHDPESDVSNVVFNKVPKGKPMTTSQIVNSYLFGEANDVSIFQSK